MSNKKRTTVKDLEAKLNRASDIILAHDNELKKLDERLLRAENMVGNLQNEWVVAKNVFVMTIGPQFNYLFVKIQEDLEKARQEQAANMPESTAK